MYKVFLFFSDTMPLTKKVKFTSTNGAFGVV